ncbi:MAG: hypothetical protein NUW37_04620 [Planctomycetes bacterium]|nr:hypothetical protein [Planctomycetota bacterium]
MINRSARALILVLWFASPFAAFAETEPEHIDFRPLSDIEKAKAEGLPIFLAANNDGEATNDSIMLTGYVNPKIVAYSKSFYCFLGNPMGHEANWAELGAPQDANSYYARRALSPERCAKFPGMKCQDHKDVWDELTRRGYLPANGGFVCPQHIFLLPDETEIVKDQYYDSAEELIGFFEQTIERARPIVREKMRKLMTDNSRTMLLGLVATLRPIQVEELFGLLVASGDRRNIELVESFANGDATDDVATRTAGIAALAVPGNTAMIAKLEPMLRDRNAVIRGAVLGALIKIGNTDSYEKAISHLKSEADEELAVGFVIEFEAIVKMNPGLIDDYAKITESRSNRVKAMAFIGLWSFPNHRASLDAFKTGADDRDRGVFIAAILGMGCVTDETLKTEAIETLTPLKDGRGPKKEVAELAFARISGEDKEEAYAEARQQIVRLFQPEQPQGGGRRR